MQKYQYIIGAALGLAILIAGAWYAFELTKKNGAPIILETHEPEALTYPITILLGGDVNMGRNIGKKIIAGDINYPFAHISDTLKDADITFVNLESQLADLGGETQSPTNEFRFAGPPESAQSLANAGIDIVSVANNHMWDYGRDRLFETLNHLETAGVVYVGANRQGDLARFKSKIIEVRGVRIGFLAMTTLLNGYENSGATKYVSFNDRAAMEAEIFRLRQEGLADFILVSIHTGTEYQTKPGQAMVELSRGLIDSGADVIVGHHPHVPQPIEVYDGKLILYSLGNFAFWQPFSFWTQHSYLAKISLRKETVDGNGPISYQVIPVRAGWQPSLLTDENSINQLRELLESPV